MKDKRYPSTPLVTCNPYFSLWSPADKLFEADVVNWTGRKQAMKGCALIDGKRYRFMGAEGSVESMEQVGFDLTATSSTYRFEATGVSLEVKFTTPLLLSDLDLVSRPVSYVSLKASSLDGKPHKVRIEWDMDETHCRAGDESEHMTVREHSYDGLQLISLGKTKQTPLNHSGDGVTIDWGYLYLGVKENLGSSPVIRSLVSENDSPEDVSRIGLVLDFGEVTDEKTDVILLGYDDTASLVYFGGTLRGYWAREGKTILEALSEAMADYKVLMKRCELFDSQLMKEAQKSVSPEYGEICSLAYRQSIAAHKLAADSKGRPLFLSKECFSNGCIGTVDVSYPSVPLYLLHNPELVEAMMRPVLEFSRMPVWEYDFAPHDVGRYPYANGQVYGLREEAEFRHKDRDGKRIRNDNTVPPYYSYPAGSDIYDFSMQMPVEECGNMLVMAAAAYKAGGSLEFVRENMDLYETWVAYLLEYGRDPGNQLCTDDFAGHLAHNANLSAKAIMGIAAYALLLDALGREKEAAMFMGRAGELAADWEERAFIEADHSALVFNDGETWGQKYNLVWDRLFGTKLFSDSVFSRESAWYRENQNEYGLPLDNRAAYTKSDWILWCAAFTDDPAVRAVLVEPVYRFLKDTPDRVPFSDWYFTDSGKKRGFQNRTVQGGLFMPVLCDRRRLSGADDE